MLHPCTWPRAVVRMECGSRCFYPVFLCVLPITIRFLEYHTHLFLISMTAVLISLEDRLESNISTSALAVVIAISLRLSYGHDGHRRITAGINAKLSDSFFVLSKMCHLSSIQSIIKRLLFVFLNCIRECSVTLLFKWLI